MASRSPLFEQVEACAEGRLNSSSVTPDDLFAWLQDGATSPSPYNEALRRAGGIPKVKQTDGTTTRVNMITGTHSAIACARCGFLAAKMQTCGGCGILHYCGRDCQKAHWPAHKARCKSIRENLARQGVHMDEDASSKAMKWMSKMPNMNAQLVSAAEKMERDGDILPLVYIVVGDNDRRCILGCGGIDTLQKLEALHREYPSHRDMLYVDDVLPEPPLRRVVVIITLQGQTTVARLRVA